mmetsp:Transcript_48240/g.103333  ORF Transcript_48240/g.103333 Transcript_48240/m.103333 type:complete len:239 (+) Transcript_48240:709-1425(+)
MEWILSRDHHLQQSDVDDVGECRSRAYPKCLCVVLLCAYHNEGNQPAYHAVVDRVHHPRPKHTPIEKLPFGSDSIEFRVRARHFIRDVVIKTKYEEYVPRGKEGVVGDGKIFREGDVSVEVVPMHPHEVGHEEDNVLVEVVAEKYRDASVGASAMAQQKRDEEAELRNSNITDLHCCSTLLPSNSYADMASQEHGDIVGSISDCERDPVLVSRSNQLHELKLLHGTQTGADAGLTRNA